MSEYEKQAQAFLTKTGTKFSAKFDHYGLYFDDKTEKESRDIYRITLSHDGKRYTFAFGQSFNDSTGDGGNPPTAYDVLSCLVMYSPGTFEDFCSEFGYDTDSRKAEKTYKAVVKQYTRLAEMYTEAELEEMADIN